MSSAVFSMTVLSEKTKATKNKHNLSSCPFNSILQNEAFWCALKMKLSVWLYYNISTTSSVLTIYVEMFVLCANDGTDWFHTLSVLLKSWVQRILPQWKTPNPVLN